MLKFSVVLSIALVLGTSACSDTSPAPRAPEVEGPSHFEGSAARNQASQFDQEIPDRPAGSAEEQGAASYILGTLQRSGYIARLDAVPVANLANSTNVIGRPFGGETVAMVVVPYGTGPGAPAESLALGTFLELARALTASAPDHKVAFTALGAEFTNLQGGHLGSRRLARFLIDEQEKPLIVQLGDISDGEPLAVAGDANEVLLGPSDGAGLAEARLPDPDVFSEAGLRRVVVSGEPEEVGALLLEFLANLGL
ncbi:MAG: hypothetical protein ACR2KQ_04670 [Actinomycetota bacterium]